MEELENRKTLGYLGFWLFRKTKGSVADKREYLGFWILRGLRFPKSVGTPRHLPFVIHASICFLYLLGLLKRKTIYSEHLRHFDNTAKDQLNGHLFMKL